MKNNIERALVISQLARRIDVRMNRTLEQTDLTMTQFRVLWYLIDHNAEHTEKAACQRDIETFFMLSNPAVTGVLKRLEAKGFIERKTDISDFRCKRIYLTERSAMLAEDMIRGKEEFERQLFRGISEEDMEAALAVLEKMLVNLSDADDL